jgi:hypothetical protein
LNFRRRHASPLFSAFLFWANMHMGASLLDIDPTVLLFSPPPRGATIHLECVWRFRFSPCPALFGSARDGVVRAGSAPELSKSLIRGIAQAGREDKWPAPLPSAPFSAGIYASRVGPPSLRKSVRKRFAARPGAFSKDIWPDAFLVPKICTHFAAEGCKFFFTFKNVCVGIC